MTISFSTDIDFKSPVWNRDSWARIHGDVNPANEKVTACSGVVLGARPDEKLRELCGFETFLMTRLLPLENGDYRRVNKEVIYYRDAFTGQLINEWTNPWTNEVVPVVDVTNDPFNYTISTHLIIAPEDFGGDKKAEPRKIPLVFPWKQLNAETLVLTTDMHLYYPNALNPEKWQRESSGPMVRVSEMMRYFVKQADLENPELTSVHHTGTWSRVTPWLPWMLMGQTPGDCLYVGTMTSSDSLDIVPQDVLDYTEQNYPQFLSAPKEDYGPSISSLEYYAKEQTPAPPLSSD
jgi:hypothetical protein